MLVFIYGDDRTIDIPVTMTYWAVRPNKTFNGEFGETILPSPFAVSILIPIIVNMLANVYFVVWPGLVNEVRVYRFIDEFVFCIVTNIGVAVTIGMTDFAQLYNLAILSSVPTLIIFLVDSSTYLELHTENTTKMFGNTKKLCCCLKTNNYNIFAILSILFTLLIYVAILVVHHVSTDARGVLHAAVYVNLVCQLLWRAVMFYIHSKKNNKGYWWMERVGSFVIVTVCTELVFWAI